MEMTGRRVAGKLMTDLLVQDGLPVAHNSYKKYCKISNPKYCNYCHVDKRYLTSNKKTALTLVA
jgi:hypothetical protein